MPPSNRNRDMQETPHNEYEIFVQQISAAMMCEPERFQQKLNQLRELYQPANVQEEFYLTQLAESQLNVQRVGQLQAGLYSRFVQQAIDEECSEAEAFPEPLREETPFNREQRLGFALAQSFTKNAIKGKVLALFARFHSDAKRNLRRDQEQFDLIRKQQLTPPPKPQPKEPEAPPIVGQAILPASRQKAARNQNFPSRKTPRGSRTRAGPSKAH